MKDSKEGRGPSTKSDSGKQGSSRVSQEATAGDWTDEEIRRFQNRVKRLQSEGMTEVEAEELATRLLHRDRPDSGDDRRICLECVGLRGRVCAFASRLGLRTGHEPLRFILQRCDGFVLRGAKTAEVSA